jgi:hypothetical protein
MNTSRKFTVQIDGYSKGAVVSLESDDLALFEKLGEGLKVLKGGGPPGVPVNMDTPPPRYFRVDSSELGEDVFNSKLALVLERGFHPSPPGGEVDDRWCFQLSEQCEFTDKELRSSEFLTIDTILPSFIVNGVVLDPATTFVEIDVDSKFEKCKSSFGALYMSNLLLIQPNRVDELNRDSTGLRLLTCNYRDKKSENEVPASALNKEFYVISSEIELPPSEIVLFNPDRGNRVYDPKTRRMCYCGFPLKLVCA